ncbi:hypothetical protein FOMPIDRAFT_1055227 [Fomitopsis schrenkii]|uniref:Uncharacterized protein n=1 Tax=Fomitopsis schrenkii TaxID=2126942 RepID=S8F5X2_FOMSC|nr:hypothetical protein FOMPIDRAFT_1055227 [Fomitopsis schrenkii]
MRFETIVSVLLASAVVLPASTLAMPFEGSGRSLEDEELLVRALEDLDARALGEDVSRSRPARHGGGTRNRHHHPAPIERYSEYDFNPVTVYGKREEEEKPKKGKGIKFWRKRPRSLEDAELFDRDFFDLDDLE